MRITNLVNILPMLGLLAAIPNVAARFDAADVPVRRVGRQVQHPSYITLTSGSPVIKVSHADKFDSPDAPPASTNAAETEKEPGQARGGGRDSPDQDVEQPNSGPPAASTDASSPGLSSFSVTGTISSADLAASGTDTVETSNSELQATTLLQTQTVVDTIVHTSFSSTSGTPAFNLSNSYIALATGASTSTESLAGARTGTVTAPTRTTAITLGSFTWPVIPHKSTTATFSIPASSSFALTSSWNESSETGSVLPTDGTTSGEITVTETTKHTVILTTRTAGPTSTRSTKSSFSSTEEPPFPWSNTTIVVAPTGTVAGTESGTGPTWTIITDSRPTSTSADTSVASGADTTSSKAGTDIKSTSCTEEEPGETSLPGGVEPPQFSTPCPEQSLTSALPDEKTSTALPEETPTVPCPEETITAVYPDETGSTHCSNKTITIFTTVTSITNISEMSDISTTCSESETETFSSADDVGSTVTRTSSSVEETTPCPESGQTIPLTTVWESSTCLEEETAYTTIWTSANTSSTTYDEDWETSTSVAVTLTSSSDATETTKTIATTELTESTDSSSEPMGTTTVWENTEKPVPTTTVLDHHSESVSKTTTTPIWVGESSSQMSDDPTTFITVWDTVSSCTTTSTWTQDESTGIEIVTVPMTLPASIMITNASSGIELNSSPTASAAPSMAEVSAANGRTLRAGSRWVFRGHQG
ncbi:hypothetical protein MKZ38_009446 [Zalerion maritima]|uniref:Uncharacterized protein n=1 Tax=Zalerion maritima TaxID=339359 RepID=A0AAD5RUH5_9PEZI|nr:hypothetical protein MKZ38_009446 [Zalerion maritima]